LKSDIDQNTSNMNGHSKQQHGVAAFTMIELLVAMSILMIIVAIVGQIFQQANVAWSTGMKSVETTMKGRSVANLIAQELSQAIISPSNYIDFTVDGSGATFWMLGEASATTNAARKVTYAWSGTTVTRNGVDLAEGIDKVAVQQGPVSAAIPLPPYITVTVTVSNSIFQTKAFLNHRERYLY
jgi:hypothetical protein